MSLGHHHGQADWGRSRGAVVHYLTMQDSVSSWSLYTDDPDIAAWPRVVCLTCYKTFADTPRRVTPIPLSLCSSSLVLAG